MPITFYYPEPLLCDICGEPLESWHIGATSGTHGDCFADQLAKETIAILMGKSPEKESKSVKQGC